MPNTVVSQEAAWKTIQSHLAATGWCTKVLIGEPKAPPDPITACILGQDGFIDENTLSSPREVHQVLLRLYAPFLEEPESQVELDLEQIRANIFADIMGDFELGGTIAYILPSRCLWRWGHLQVANAMYRVLDITVSYRVDDKATFTA